MKRLLLIMLVLVLACGYGFAATQEGNVPNIEEPQVLKLQKKIVVASSDAEINEALQEVQDAQREIIMNLKDIGDIKTKVIVNKMPIDSAPDAAYFGIYVEDLTFPKAQELKYPNNYGVLVTGIVPDSPAWKYRLQEDDIIMKLAGKEATNYSVFEKTRKTLRAGDVITLVIFRSGQVESLDMTMGSRPSNNSAETINITTNQKKKLSRGYGGGSWIPMWVDLDFSDINALVTDSLIGHNAFRDKGILQQGIGGKLPIGKGFFVGGQVTTYEDVKKVNNPIPANAGYNIWLRYSNTMGGVTLDKRIPITKNLITSLGMMVGGAGHELEFINSNANFDWNTLPNTISNTNNTHFLVQKGYLLVQPRAEVMYRLLSWFGIRAEGGYTYGMPLTEDWRVKGMNGETFSVRNSPKTPFEGYTITVGPWFGF